MPISDCDVRDPRMKRTRQLLQSGLRDLLRQKTLDEIGVQDITAAATVNRATFYDHYTDKFALFTAMIESDFHKLLEARQVDLDDCSSTGLAALVLAVCEYLGACGKPAECARHDSFAPLRDNAITRVIRRLILEGLSKQAGWPHELAASALSSAIYGAAKDWFSSANRRPDKKTVSSIVQLVLPLTQASRPAPRR